MLVVSSALYFVVSFVEIEIDGSFVPQLLFVKPLKQLLMFSSVSRGEHPVRNEKNAVVVRFLLL